MHVDFLISDSQISRKFLVSRNSNESSVCKDTLDNCAQLGHAFCSGSYLDFAKENCQKYCNLCPVVSRNSNESNVCKDALDNCAQLGHAFCSGSYLDFAKENCQKYCNLCPVSVCDYKGTQYSQGQSWTDGCDYNCTCEDATLGYYRCRNLCPQYTGLPASCNLVKQPEECCVKPECSVRTTALPQNVCDYKGRQYSQGQSWTDGCDYNCTCEDATLGYYRCTNLCSQYTNLPPGCFLIKRPGECCDSVICPLTIKPNAHGCTFNGHSYSQGETWKDGCRQSCTCTGESVKIPSCHAVCLNWNLPKQCTMEPVPQGLCCQQPKCPTGVIIQIPSSYKDQYPHYSNYV